MPAGYEKIVNDAFHGTSLPNGKEIVMHGFRLEGGDQAFLGNGVYFYEGSLQYAKMWARTRVKTGEKICVIQALVNLGLCLDLNTQEGVEVVEELVEEFRKKGRKVSSGAIIALICSKVDIETIRGTDVKRNSKKLFAGDDRVGFFTKAPLIICIKKLENIVNFDICYDNF